MSPLITCRGWQVIWGSGIYNKGELVKPRSRRKESTYNYLCNKGIGAFWECVSNAEEWLACTTEVVVFTITSVRADE